MLRPGELVIHNANYRQFLSGAHVVNGQPVRTGLIPRDYGRYPLGCYGGGPPYTAVDFPLIPQADWPSRIKDLEDTSSRISDMRLVGNNGQSIPALDQNGRGYCVLPGTRVMMADRTHVGNLPYVGLSAYAVACIIKNYADEGGWGAQGLDFIMARGVPSEAFWPMQSVSRSNDNAATWADAARHKVTEGFIDLASAQYDRNLSFAQVATCLLSRIPVVVDYNWWSHSICAIDLVNGASVFGVLRAASGKLFSLPEFELAWDMDDPVTAGIGVRILNSWSDTWSDRGMGVLAPSKSVPDGSVAPRVTMAA